MTGVIATIPRYQFFDSKGKPLVGGKLYTYLAGTTTPVATYQDQDLTIKNGNPIPLDGSGSCTIWLDPAKQYKFVLKDAKGVTQPGWPVDNISGAANMVSLAPTLSTFAKLSILASQLGSSLIGFVQLGVGAILRTIQDKLRVTIDVEDFGAVGDNAADDTAALVKAFDALRARGGGRIRFSPGKTYYMLPTGGTNLKNWFDLSGCYGVTVEGNGAKIRTGAVTASQYLFDLNGTVGVKIENLRLASGHQVRTDLAGIFWIRARWGARSIVLENVDFDYGVAGFVAQGKYMNEGDDTNRVRGIRLNNVTSNGTYYPALFQSAGDNVKGNIITRNAGRSYFAFNVHDHEMTVDSQQGGPFSDVLLKAYGTTAFYSKLSNIKLVYKTDGRYAGSGNQSAEEAMVAMDFQLNPTNPAACMFSNIDIQLDVTASAADRNQNVFTIRKYDANGNPDTVARGHNLVGLKLHGAGYGLQNLLANSLNLFARASENWTGEFVYGMHIHDLFLGNVAAQDAVLLNGTPIVGACKLERVKTEGGLALTNIGGKELSIEESSFRNYSAKSRILQSYPVAWTADGTAPNIGSGSLVGYYTSDGKTCTVDLYFKAAADTTFGSGIWHFSLPMQRAVAGYGSVGSAMSLDAGATYYDGTCRVLAGASVMELMLGGNPGNFANASSPIVWANQDYFAATITYPIE